jgi:DNA-directed RNA polymerase specialized sigma24 family protein
MRRDRFIDFFYVAPQQQEIHKRLENWAQSHFSAGGSSASPMFRLYRPDNYERGAPAIPVDSQDAHKIAKGVHALPDKHRHALNWNYIEGGSPTKARQKLGVTLDGLMSLITDARTMLINRGV